MEANPENQDSVVVDTENYTCPNCGGVMKFDIKKQKFVCSSCLSESEIQALTNEVKEYDFSEYHEREKHSVPFKGIAVAICHTCGAEITFGSEQIAAICPMCSSTQIAPAKQKAGLPPDGIIPFKVDKAQAQENFRKWAKGRWFAPNKFKTSFTEGNLIGMYLPFWTYDASVRSTYIGRGGKYRKVKSADGKSDRIVTDWYPVSGVVTSDFDDIQICASNKESMITDILPYGTSKVAVPFSNQYLSGYYAEHYKIKADAGFARAKSIMESTMRDLAHSKIRRHYDCAEVHSLNSTYSNVEYKYVLLPVWSSDFGYNGKSYRYLINGETGRVSGSRPYSIIKITMAIIIALVAAYLFFSYTQKSENSMPHPSVDRSITAQHVEYQRSFIQTESPRKIDDRHLFTSSALVI